MIEMGMDKDLVVYRAFDKQWFSLSKAERFGRLLCDWFRANRQRFPWWAEKSRDPYVMLITGVFFSRNRAAVATPFTEKFVRRYPSFLALHDASTAELARFIRPVGLAFRRASQLKQIAEYVIHKYNGHVPADRETLLRIPGIGPFIAGMILCFAYQKDVVAYDTNAERIGRRVFTATEIDQIGDLSTLLERAIPEGEGYNFNRGLFNLGGTFCTPRRPRCTHCPLATLCAYNIHPRRRMRTLVGGG